MAIQQELDSDESFEAWQFEIQAEDLATRCVELRHRLHGAFVRVPRRHGASAFTLPSPRKHAQACRFDHRPFRSSNETPCSLKSGSSATALTRKTWRKSASYASDKCSCTTVMWQQWQ